MFNRFLQSNYDNILKILQLTFFFNTKLVYLIHMYTCEYLIQYHQKRILIQLLNDCDD